MRKIPEVKITATDEKGETVELELVDVTFHPFNKPVIEEESSKFKKTCKKICDKLDRIFDDDLPKFYM